MAKANRGWHNPAKQMEAHKEGKCPYCKKHVKSLNDHIHDKHRTEKQVRKR